MRTYAAYLRKSRADADKTIEEVLASHRHDLIKLARSLDVGIVDWYEEVVSGESISARPQVQALLDAVDREQYYAVFCMDIDRLGRGDMMDQGLILSTFKRSETKIITPQKTYDLANETDETMSEIEALFSRIEYKTIRKRMRRGIVACLEKGGYVSVPPYGYESCKINKIPSLRIVPEEARFIHLIFDRYCSGIGPTAIAEELTSLGSVPRKNPVWNKDSVVYVLRNPVYCGKILYNRYKHTKRDGHEIVRQNPEEKWITAQGLHPAIISEEQFAQAERIRKGNERPVSFVSPTGPQHQFAGIFRCSKCGHTLFTQAGARGGPRLTCYTKNCSAAVKVSYVEERLLSALRAELNRLTLSENIDLTEDLEEADRMIQSLEAEIQKCQSKKSRLYSFLEDGIYDRQTFLDRMELVEKDLSSLNQRLEKARSTRSSMQSSDPRILKDHIQTALTLWPTASPLARNDLLKTLIARAEYTKEKKTKPDEFSISISLRNF